MALAPAFLGLGERRLAAQRLERWGPTHERLYRNGVAQVAARVDATLDTEAFDYGLLAGIELDGEGTGARSFQKEVQPFAPNPFIEEKSLEAATFAPEIHRLEGMEEAGKGNTWDRLYGVGVAKQAARNAADKAPTDRFGRAWGASRKWVPTPGP